MSLVNFILEHQTLAKAERIIFYGGSFNPWHQGHQACVELAPKKAPLIVLPDNNPHKEIPFQKSLNLDELEKELKIRHDVYLFREFFYSKSHTPTVDWIVEVKKNFPNKKLDLLLGFDSAQAIDSWKDSQLLLKTLDKLYVVSRLETDELRDKLQKKLLKNIELIFLGRHQYEHISSTKLRSDC